MTEIRQRFQGLKLAHVMVCVLGSLLLTGCASLTFTYNYGERFLLWRLDRYFHLSREQEGLVRDRLADLHAWHRKAELPRYAQFLQQIQERWHDGLTTQEVDVTFDTFQKLRAELAQRVAVESAVFLRTVDAKQIGHLERVVQRDNLDLQSEARSNYGERSAKRRKRVVSWVRDWLGPLTPEQERRIGEVALTLPDTTEWIDYRIHRDQQFITLLRSNPAPGVLEHHVQEWITSPEKSAPAAYAASLQHFQQTLKSAILEIDRTVTSRQRQHAAERLQLLIREIQLLAAR